MLVVTMVVVAGSMIGCGGCKWWFQFLLVEVIEFQWLG